ncbi:hypothetical protein BWI17_19575 [Betaproteobacteria bacterium GR16-43]|nr:hypothetical protein BWI17_19575 [Betaproteobacteria bacterium GR16-43]
MREVYEPKALAAALRDARARTLAIYAHLDDQALAFPYREDVNPPLWELSHLAWFQEFWCTRYREDDPTGERTPSIAPDADRRFNSALVAHRDRWDIARMPRSEVLDFLGRTLETTLKRLKRSDEAQRYFFRLALLHEDMHGEAFLMSLQSLGLPGPDLPGLEPPPALAAPARDVYFSGGDFLQGGSSGRHDFAFDNELPGQQAHLEQFSIAERAVTQGEFARFVVDEGYTYASLWSGAGRRWKADENVTGPRYWKRDGDAWLVRRFDQWHPLDPDAPMVHVTFYEAEAYCRWSGRRLPTEAEWEFAARNGGGQRFPWGDEPAFDAPALDYRHRGPSGALADPGNANSPLRQMLGGVWEWTATPFEPYAGFVAGPYQEYSEPWFQTHQVLRGGSFATRSRLVHNRWRNFYQAHRGDAFAGLRTCALDA